MNIETTNTATTQLLNEYYQISTQAIPTQRVKSEWQDDNKRGFFLGIIQEGETSHITRLHNLLTANQFAEQQEFSTKIQLADPKHHCTFIDDMFGYYILPFHKDYNDSSSWHTPVSSNPTSRTNSADDLDYAAKLSLQGAHIISQKNIGMAYNKPSILLRSGLTQKHQIQNGLLLCIKCHDQFGKLKQYVDVVDDKLVIKVINETNDLTSDKHKKWIETIEDLKVIRRTRQKRWIDNRQTVESNSEMTLYFIHNNLTRLPNRNALELHKTTCLIWRMAGGVESDDEYCPYDDDGCTPVDYQNSSDDDVATNDRGTDSAVFLHFGETTRYHVNHVHRCGNHLLIYSE
ncbi:hypothetical protein BATDEDRAFT_28539 [Batrachochytrium dendrobatidis JAM81]|uniref:HNH nuclease domain-containing protein n=1 Tax=Batrachochytrium dendrobatidis (strain JAM81 / FGSC 10211) TaxID=684364 RepID=F4PEC9_BATDJ|nr:uncharacterized protein BATDEDRAFT_28539 [Batrachochytrium dendrobatidis JAM81]EGF76353.1 hypothetical protein BATDEDRAFT_28539 [Batrachochytrium dendrobatidis JAM81]|eukprot:XP_006682959.1 hypothetical protein BATDEDRAFT_28539 [Batrachochytrium dendrobatidis JAM81]